MKSFYKVMAAGVIFSSIFAGSANAQWARIDTDSTMIGALPLWQLFEDQGDGKVCIQEDPIEECTYDFCNPSGISPSVAWGQCLKALRAANPDCLAVMVDLTAICGSSYTGRFLVAL